MLGWRIGKDKHAGHAVNYTKGEEQILAETITGNHKLLFDVLKVRPCPGHIHVVTYLCGNSANASYHTDGRTYNKDVSIVLKLCQPRINAGAFG